jgi:hypothetical protein
MQQWLAAAAAGVVLGLAFFGFVRLRMHLGPIIRQRYGNRARQAYWIATILTMVLLAKGALYGLRLYLDSLDLSSSYLLPEVLFITVAVTLAMTLIYRRINRNN